jgi:hypothetical protein
MRPRASDDRVFVTSHLLSAAPDVHCRGSNHRRPLRAIRSAALWIGTFPCSPQMASEHHPTPIDGGRFARSETGSPAPACSLLQCPINYCILSKKGPGPGASQMPHLSLSAARFALRRSLRFGRPCPVANQWRRWTPGAFHHPRTSIAHASPPFNHASGHVFSTTGSRSRRAVQASAIATQNAWASANQQLGQCLESRAGSTKVNDIAPS